ncbi:MAG: peptide deformylase [Rhodospirillales bacterium]|nr:peptide deformylase [Rhodospirillales bacterium]MCW9039968.1 peptide deformylase [Rhodospirillales bacterium]
MAILKIARMGHPVLRLPAAPVEDPTAPEISALVADMVETLADAGGVGLAAPQVHVGKRLVIFHVPAAREAAERYRDSGLEEESAEVGLTVLINPEIEPVGEETEEAWEGCLSIPGMMGAVRRPSHIRYRGFDLNGDRIEREAKGFHARVVQHECDHLDGTLYPMRMDDLSLFGFSEELRAGFRAGDSGGADDMEAEE